MLGAEGNGVREIAGIGSAAHGVKFGLLSGDFVIGVDTSLDLRRIRFDIERFHFRNGFADAMLAEFFIDGCGDLSTGGVGGIAAVKALEEFSVLDSDDSADNGERRELFVVCVNADSGSIGAGMECFENRKIFSFGLGTKLVIKDIIYEHADGIDLAFRHGSMAGFSCCIEGDKAVFCGNFYAFGFFRKFAFAFEHCGCFIRDHVEGHSAFDAHNSFRCAF